MTNFIFVDGSYFVFYRYFATLAWWKHANSDEDCDNLNENEIFMNKFRELFVKKLREIPKKLNLDTSEMYIALDCPRQQIWRNAYHSNYKGDRTCAKGIGEIFKIVMSEELFNQKFIKGILSCPELEGDDCIALSVKHLQKLKQLDDDLRDQIYIITSDCDFMQLKDENTHIINLKYKIVGDKKTTGDPNKDLFLKVVCGDKSDGIINIFKNMRIGPKTAVKYFDDHDKFKVLCMKDDEGTYERYLTNKKLISFDEIPSEHVENFNKLNKDIR